MEAVCDYDVLGNVILILFITFIAVMAIRSELLDLFFDFFSFLSFLFEEKSEEIKYGIVVDFKKRKILFSSRNYKYYIWVQNKNKKYKIQVSNQAEFEFYSNFALPKKKSIRDFLIKKRKFKNSYELISLCKFV